MEPKTVSDNREKKLHGSERRERQKSVRARVTETEYAAIEARARRVGLSTAAYLRACALGDSGPRAKRSPTVNAALLGTALADLNRVGNNLNQIAHHLNAGGHPNSALMVDARAELVTCLQTILKALGRAE